MLTPFLLHRCYTEHIVNILVLWTGLDWELAGGYTDGTQAFLQHEVFDDGEVSEATIVGLYFAPQQYGNRMLRLHRKNALNFRCLDCCAVAKCWRGCGDDIGYRLSARRSGH